eukprot:1976355-Alexandrium_andersonii.AAC.1
MNLKRSGTALDRPNGDRRRRPGRAQEPPGLDRIATADRNDKVDGEDHGAADDEQEPAELSKEADPSGIWGSVKK